MAIVRWVSRVAYLSRFCDVDQLVARTDIQPGCTMGFGSRISIVNRGGPAGSLRYQVSMALTVESEQRLEKVGLVKLFEGSKAAWKKLASQSYDFVKRNFPNGATIRPDDVSKALVPLLEVNEKLSKYLDENKLTQKYWIRDFGDFVIDKCWQEIKD